MKVKYTLYGKEKVLSKIRNVYVKTKGKTRYVKYKGEFVKLNEFVKKNKKVIVRKEEEEGVLYFVYGNKGGGFSDDVLYEKDKRVSVEYINPIVEVLNNPDNEAKYNEISKFLYSYTMDDGKTIYIKPFIKFKKDHSIIIKFYLSCDEWIHPKGKGRLWIDVPIHMTQFFQPIKDADPQRNSTHIHITAEPDKLSIYNIYYRNYDNLKHIYLQTNSIETLTHMINNYSTKIFDWIIEYRNDEVIITSYYILQNNKWREIKLNIPATSQHLPIFVDFVNHKTLQPVIPSSPASPASPSSASSASSASSPTPMSPLPPMSPDNGDQENPKKSMDKIIYNILNPDIKPRRMTQLCYFINNKLYSIIINILKTIISENKRIPSKHIFDYIVRITEHEPMNIQQVPPQTPKVSNVSLQPLKVSNIPLQPQKVSNVPPQTPKVSNVPSQSNVPARTTVHNKENIGPNRRNKK